MEGSYTFEMCMFSPSNCTSRSTELEKKKKEVFKWRYHLWKVFDIFLGDEKITIANEQLKKNVRLLFKVV